MRLVRSDFGFGAGDPMVPACEYTGVLFAGSPLEYLVWGSFLPLAGDESTTAFSLEQRADGVMEIAQDLGGVRDPWSVEVTPTESGVEVEILVGGSQGWIEALSPLAMKGLEARASQICAMVWAAWHATGHALDGEHARGILWLRGAGADWTEAVGIAAGLMQQA
jgi:hypothetical protein